MDSLVEAVEVVGFDVERTSMVMLNMGGSMNVARVMLVMMDILMIMVRVIIVMTLNRTAGHFGNLAFLLPFFHIPAEFLFIFLVQHGPETLDVQGTGRNVSADQFPLAPLLDFA